MRALWQHRLKGYPFALATLDKPAVVAVVGIDGELSWIDAETGKLTRHIVAHQGGTTGCFAFRQRGTILTGGEDGRICLWHPNAEAPAWCEEIGGGWVEAVAGSPHGEIAAGRGRELFVWDDEGKPLFFASTDSAIRHLFFRNRNELVVIQNEAVQCLALAQRGERLNNIPLQSSPQAARLSPDGRWLACGVSSKGIWLIKPQHRDNEALHIGPLQTKPKCLAWSSDGNLLAFATGETPLVIQSSQWEKDPPGPTLSNPRGTEEPMPIPGCQGVCSALEFHPVMPWLAVGTREGHAVVHALDRDERLFDEHIPGGEVACIAWTPETHRPVFATGDGLVACYETGG